MMRKPRASRSGLRISALAVLVSVPHFQAWKASRWTPRMIRQARMHAAWQYVKEMQRRARSIARWRDNQLGLRYRMESGAIFGQEMCVCIQNSPSAWNRPRTSIVAMVSQRSTSVGRLSKKECNRLRVRIDVY
jgi:hypothetical protein